MSRTGDVLDHEAAIATLRELLHEAEHGTLNCIALRIYHAGGNWEDLVFGGTPAEQAQALDHLWAARD
ncbi:hypothetical protein J2X67_005456 [Variovorax sp. 3319]|nr:hypothetical protein [Variovorax sp. 3319]